MPLPKTEPAAIMDTKNDLLVAEYLATHPDFVPSGHRHPSIVAIGEPLQPWLTDILGGSLGFWQAMLKAAKTWFPVGSTGHPLEFRLFCYYFEAAGNTFWEGRPEFEWLQQEYLAWRRSHNPRYGAGDRGQAPKRAAHFEAIP